MSVALALVLPCHVPFVRAPGRDIAGEEALHETIAWTIIPTIELLDELAAMGVDAPVTLAWSPVLLEQLADAVVQKHFTVWLDQWEQAARLAHAQAGGDRHLAYLSRYTADWALTTRMTFERRFGRDLVGALRQLCAGRAVEMLAMPALATPLDPRWPTLDRLQLQLGADVLGRRLQLTPRGLWLPECQWHPACAALVHSGPWRYTVIDPTSFAGAPVPARAGWLVPGALAAAVRHAAASQRCLSPTLGYRGDPVYRGGRREPRWGLPTLARDGAPYDPFDAFQRATEHAADFAAYLGALAATEDEVLVVLPLDAAVFGRGWYEGPHWLRTLLTLLHEQPAVRLTTLGAAVPPEDWPMPSVRPGSWLAPGAAPAWQLFQRELAAAELRVRTLVHQRADVTGERWRALLQGCRELLLAHGAADATHGAQHLQACLLCCELAARAAWNDDDRVTLESIEEHDNPFADLAALLPLFG
jgi:1,4-alpha-glucan branching enzyme